MFTTKSTWKSIALYLSDPVVKLLNIPTLQILPIIVPDIDQDTKNFSPIELREEYNSIQHSQLLHLWVSLPVPAKEFPTVVGKHFFFPSERATGSSKPTLSFRLPLRLPFALNSFCSVSREIGSWRNVVFPKQSSSTTSLGSQRDFEEPTLLFTNSRYNLNLTG